MKKTLLYFLLLTSFLSLSKAQNIKSKNSPKDFGYTVFTIKGSKDSIHFIVSDTTFKTKKPIFLFSQGSYPTALFWKEDATHTWQQFIPFEYKQYLEDYNFVIISKPAIPVFAYTADKNYFYVDPVTKKIPQEYYDKSYLDYYVAQANDVIDYLVKQSWVDRSKIIIAGHSQGSKVVSVVGAINKNVTHVIYLSGNPIGRFDQNIRQLRRDALLGNKSSEKAQDEINKLYLEWNTIYKNPNDTHSSGGDTNKAWISFSTPELNNITNIKVPLFIAYGTKDITSDYCDLLPIDFVRVGKSNFTMKPYLDCDHNFNRPTYDKNGKKLSTEALWNSVAKDFFNWIKEQP